MNEEWIPSVTALVSVAIGALVTLYTVRRQVNASMISASRQAWINSLRDAISEFLAVTAQLRHLVATCQPSEWQNAPGFERAIYLRSRIALLINPKEDDHRQLVMLVDKAFSITTVLQDTEARIRSTELHHEITTLSQAVLKREWERVKAGEPLFSLRRLRRGSRGPGA